MRITNPRVGLFDCAPLSIRGCMRLALRASLAEWVCQQHLGVWSRLVQTRSLREPADAPASEFAGRYCGLRQEGRFSQPHIEFDHTGYQPLAYSSNPGDSETDLFAADP